MNDTSDTRQSSGNRAGPLSGVRVLDIATMIAAPLTASILGDYGADVVKVELPGRGDTGRKMGAQRFGQGLYWKATLGRNKRSVALDLRTVEGQELLLRWLPRFDVLIENFRPGTLDRYNLSEDRIRVVHPTLIILRMTAFGQTGPYRTRHGFGTIAETMSGVASILLRGLRGFSAARPALTSFPLGDVSAGMMGVNGILAALYRRERTGRGDTIDLAIYEALLKFMELEISRFDPFAGPDADEVRRPDSAPRGVYRCRDGVWIALSGSTQPVADRVLRLVGGETLVVDPRFLSQELRIENVDALDDLIEAWCVQRSSAEVITDMSAAGCAVGPVETVETLLRNSQVVARGAVLDVEDDDIGTLRMTNVTPRFASQPRPPPPRPAPSRVGADTIGVLQQDLQLSDSELDRLRAAKVIG